MRKSIIATRWLVLLSIPTVLSACTLNPALPTIVASTTECDFRPILAEQQRTAKSRDEQGLTGEPQSVGASLHANVLDAAISNKVQIHQVKEFTNQSGITHVNAVVVNCTDFPLALQGRTKFVNDLNGDFEVSAWKSVYVAGRSQEFYAENSLSNEGIAARLIEFREGF